MLGTGPVAGIASPEGVRFDGGRIDALLLCEGQVLRTSDPGRVRLGLAHVRRRVEGAHLRLLHVVFAPVEPRPVLFGLAKVASLAPRPLRVDYVELWDLSDGPYRPAEGACERLTPAGVRVLADLGTAVRARPPEEAPSRGLALDVRLVLPPGGLRTLSFAYAAPAPGEDAGVLVRAWRGEVQAELSRTTRVWSERLGHPADPVQAYRTATARG